MLTFEISGDGQRVCGNVSIINDMLDEPNEQFSVRITSVLSPSVMIGPSNETCVTIIDDDSKYHYTKIIVVRLCVCPSVTGGHWKRFDLER